MRVCVQWKRVRFHPSVGLVCSGELKLGDLRDLAQFSASGSLLSSK